MQELINLGIICLAGVIAYAIGAMFNYIDHCRYMSDLKKFFKSDLNRYQAIKVMKEAERLMLDFGFDKKPLAKTRLNTVQKLYKADYCMKNLKC